MSTSRSAVVLAGRYRLEDWIATGGMGEVWRASDLVLHRRVAVKLLRAEYAQHPETLARFRAEARHAGSLSHPRIAQIYDYGEAEGAHPPFLVMELVDGPPLARLLAAGPLDPARVMDVIAQVADGLAAAHAAGLVHRDIKPGNLLLAPGLRVKITDFGIAHATGAAPVTRTGMLIGTPAYLAPERVAGAAATPASDLYSLGIVGYECLAGAPPFAGTAMEIALAQQLRPLPPLPAAVPAEAAALVAALTAKDPAARPASAREVASRARQLRDAMTAAAAPQPGARPAFPPGAPGTPADPQAATVPGAWQPYPSAAPAAAEPPTLAGDPATLSGPWPPGPQSPRPRRRLLRTWPPRARAAALAAVAAAVIAGLAGWALAGTASPQRATTPPARSSSAGHSAAVQTVNVNGDALAGQPAQAVVQRLRQLGLQVRVQQVRTGEQPPGTVVSVQPGGNVRAGSTVTVTAALPPAGHPDKHRHGHGGDGHGNGNGNGAGGD
jgi:serine/threonine-protein kinase